MEVSELQSIPEAQTGINCLSDIRNYFGDQEEVNRILLRENPVIYEFTSIKKYNNLALLSLGITIIHPGKVGEEFYMTKGHFHDLDHDGDEVYYVKSGKGQLLLLSRKGEFKTLEMKPGKILYTPNSWAHRTANTGSEDLVFLSVWPAATEYDYEAIREQGGFPKRIVERDQAAVVVDNQNFRG
jgi:glucose-6-phosphate isomerase